MRRLLLFSFLIIYSSLNAQLDERVVAIDMSFLHKKIQISSSQSFFNILKIKNNSNSSFQGQIKFTTPADWTIVGEKEINITLSPHQSLELPLRVIVSNRVNGEIAYSIVANLFDRNSRSIKSEYCFVNIPRLSDLKIKTDNKIIYIDNKTSTAIFKYTISNKGNVNELLQFLLTGDEALSSNNIPMNKQIAVELNIPAHSDTVIDFPIRYDEKKDSRDKEYYKVNIGVHTQDSLYKNTLWLNKVNSEYNHVIPEDNKCAIIEITSGSILSTKKPRYSAYLKGTFLLKKNVDLYYMYNNSFLNSEILSIENNLRAYVGIKTNLFHLRLGSTESYFNEYSIGTGGNLSIKYGITDLNSFYSYNKRYGQVFYAGKIGIQLNPRLKIITGYAENNYELSRNYSKIFTGGAKFIVSNNRFEILSYLNNTTFAFTQTPFNKQGFSIIGNYNGNFKKFTASVRAEYGSPDYSGIYRGRTNINSSLSYSINNLNTIQLYNTINNFVNKTYIDDILQPIPKLYSNNFGIIYDRGINRKINLILGPNIRNDRYNAPYLVTNENTYFGVLNTRVNFSIRYNDSRTQLYIKPSIDFGNIKVVEADILNNNSQSNYFTYNLSLYSKYKNIFLYALYRNGPVSLYGQYYHYTENYYPKWFLITPSYDKNFFNNRLNINLRVNYRYDIASSDKYFSVTPQFQFYFPHFWTLRFLSSFTSNSKIDFVTSSIYRYNSSYFELAVRKEINCKQPRFQYHDLKVVFFKDLNGNRKKEPNEPGLRNVLTSIERDYEVDFSEDKIDFISTKLLTGPGGTISYTNITNGPYKLKYVLIGDMVGNFNREELSQQFVVDEDKTIYIPYLENNRIIGKVILNRDPLSSLEQNIDISNIRIIAEDTQGHTYSALTDKRGRFTLYTPVTDHYFVKINNIFYESFDIQQAEYIVKFNGYKQFEVSFVFDEKKRKISFDNELEVEDLKLDDIKVIRKTTLSGKIRDAISLEPIEAEIKIIDNRSNKVVSRAISNRLNGNYSISYAAGTHFRVEVISKDYWEHIENLYIEQVISIQNINKDMMLNKLSESRDEQKTFIIYEKEEKFEDNFKRGQQIPINYLNFDLKQTRLDPKAKPELDRLIDLLNKNKSVKIEIAGHADDKGNARIENIIAKRRAEAVEKYLSSHGLPKNRISVKSYSNSRPLIPGTSEKARSKNRRVEIIVQ